MALIVVAPITVLVAMTVVVNDISWFIMALFKFNLLISIICLFSINLFNKTVPIKHYKYIVTKILSLNLS